jgi:hypothetical protein
MTTVSYEPKMGMIRVDLAPETWPAEVHSGPEGRSVTLRLTRLEVARLIEQLVNANRHANRAEELWSRGVAIGAF